MDDSDDNELAVRSSEAEVDVSSLLAKGHDELKDLLDDMDVVRATVKEVRR